MSQLMIRPAQPRISQVSHRTPLQGQRVARSDARSPWRQPRQAAGRSKVLASAEAAGSGGTTTVAPSGASVPTLLNAIPHDRQIRKHFYREATQGMLAALDAGEKRIEVRCTIPELNTEFDVYRAGTMLELVREMATALSADGKRVRVCVQQPLGKGVFAGLPLSLNGIARMLTAMDWGPAAGFVSLGALGAEEVEGGDVFVLISPQNIVGHSVLPLLEEMAEAAGAQGKPLILVNPKLADIQSAGGVMSVRGRQGRMDFASTFTTAYHFRLLYLGATMYPIMGAMRFCYGGEWEVFKRVELGLRQEEYRFIASFPGQPSPREITEAFQRARSTS